MAEEPFACTYRELAALGEADMARGHRPDMARRDAEALLLHLLQKESPERNRAWLLAHWDDPMDRTTFREFVRVASRRRSGQPVQYILGHAEFFGLPFYVEPEVLIPRPETEHLVEETLRLAARMKEAGEIEIRIADVGTGSGAIAVALAHSLSDAEIVATDLSDKALALAQRNADRNNLAGRIEFLHGNLLEPLAGRRFSILASNPPYIPWPDKSTLPVEVRDHEPHLALFGGNDGLDIYRRLIPGAREVLIPKGWLVLEIGFGQQPAIQEMLLANGYGEVHFIPDYQGIPRVAAGRNI